MLRSLLHLSGRLLRPPNPRFPSPLSPPLPTSPRFHSSSSSSLIPGGARWATHDYDPLIDRLCASASDTPVECDAWVVYDPVSGRIVMQEPPLSPSSTKEEDVEGAGEREEHAGVKGKEEMGKGKRTRRKGWASASGEEGQTSQSSVAAARKSAGKGCKESVSFVCSCCGARDSQWWGYCRHCKATGSLQRSRDMVLQSLQEVNMAIQGAPLSSSSTVEEEGEGEGEGEREDKDNVGVKEEKGRWKGKRRRKGRASVSGEEEGQTTRSSVVAVRNSDGKGSKRSVRYMCSHCGECASQWWGICRHCKAKGTLQRSREMVVQSLQKVSIAIERPPLSSYPTAEEEGKGAGECEDENVGVKKENWKRKRMGKERVSYVCSHCGECASQWWGICRHCQANGTLQKSREMVVQSLQKVNKGID